MSKRKYIKNSKGVTMSVTTDTLGLEKPLLNENYNIDVHNRNMDKIDEDLKPIDDSYIIELFQHDGDTTNPKDYYTKDEADLKYATKEDANIALDRANEAFQRGDNVKTQLVDKLISEGLDVSTNNTFEELIGGISLGKRFAIGNVLPNDSKRLVVDNLNFEPSIILAYHTIYNISIFVCGGMAFLKWASGSGMARYTLPDPYSYIKINNTGFDIYCDVVGSSVNNEPFDWYAFE